MSYAVMICKKENEKEDCKKLIQQLSEAYRKRGTTLYNWIRCEEVFPQDIFPYLEFLKKHKGNNSKTAFNLFWENLIKFHHSRIFIASTMLKEDLEDEILKRALLYDISKIFVYARKSRIKFSEGIINNILNKDLDNFLLGKKDYKLGDGDAKTFIISKK